MEIGDLLFTLDNQKVKVIYFDDKTIRIEYKGKVYERPISHIGTKLFIYDKDGYDYEGFDEYGINKKLEVKKGSKADVEFVGGRTVLYHKIYGDGIFVKFEKNEKTMYIFVKFSVGEKQFIFPDCFKSKYLSQKSSEKLSKQKENLNTEYGLQEFQKEKCYFDNTIQRLDKDILNSSLRIENSNSYYYNEVYDEVFVKRDISCEAHNNNVELRAIRNNPYFACIQTAFGKKYIGKKRYGDIVDWADPLCSIYYNFQLHIGREQTKLSLVRDFDIGNGVFVNYFDKYNLLFETNNDDDLLRKIKNQRQEKTTHDIIDTIRSNQYNIITATTEKEIAVEGCAGSGKTMILLHRLHYLMRNDKSLSNDKVYILSPTSLLVTECDELSKTLNIDKVAKFSNSMFYSMIIERSVKKLDVFLPKRVMPSKSNEFIPDQILKKIYSFVEIEDIKDSVYLVLYDDDIRKDFIRKEKEKNKKARLDFWEDGRFFVECDIESDAYYDKYLEAVNELKDTSIENVDAILKAINNENLSIKNKEFRRSVLNFLKNNEQLLGSVSRKYQIDSKDLIYSRSDAYKKTYDFLEAINWSSDNYMFRTMNPFAKFQNEYVPIYEREKCLNKFEIGNNYSYLFYIIQHFIEEKKQIYGLKKSEILEWEEFYYAYVISEYSNFKFENAKICFVDEFQDYSKLELSLIERMFPLAKLNFWGDFNQQVIAKGVSKNDFKQFLNEKSGLSFKINENYRNAREITEYINENFNMEMIPIGLSGTVKECAISCVDSIKISPSDRVAIIYSDFNELDAAVRTIKQHELAHKIIGNNTDKIERGIYNLISVQMSKGLEFETVIVLSKTMTEKEKYVSMTRALNELYVIK